MKTLTIFRPNTIQNALSDFDRYFESFLDGSIPVPASRMFDHVPAMDIQETENSYVLDMELPGYDEKNIEVHVDNSSLTISSKEETAAKEQKNDEDKRSYIIRERKICSFSRSFKLPENADPETVSAAFKNGVLSLQIKKRTEAQKRTIQINAA